jgi:hypothetical protein
MHNTSYVTCSGPLEGEKEKEKKEGEEEKIMLIVSQRKSFSTCRSLSQNINYSKRFSQWYNT